MLKRLFKNRKFLTLSSLIMLLFLLSYALFPFAVTSDSDIKCKTSGLNIKSQEVSHNTLSANSYVSLYVEIITPSDGMVIYDDKVLLKAKIYSSSLFTPSKIFAYVNGNPQSLLSDYISQNQTVIGYVNLPNIFNSPINITLYVEDITGNDASDTVFVYRYLDEFMPENYEIGMARVYTPPIFQLTRSFNWTFSWNYSNVLNVVLFIIPTVTFEFKIGYLFDFKYGAPKTLDAGDNFTLLLEISNMSAYLLFSMNATIDYYYYINYLVETYEDNGTFTLFTYQKSLYYPFPVGFSTYDLRYDLSEISEDIKGLTHYEIDLAKYVSLSTFGIEIPLVIDIIPILKIYNEIIANLLLNGTIPSEKVFSFTKDVYLTQNLHVFEMLDGTDYVNMFINDFSFRSMAGIDISVNMSLYFSAFGFNLGPYNLNQFIYDTLGLLVPSYNFWYDLGTVDLMPYIQDIELLTIPINPKKLIIDFYKLSANETSILIQVRLTDEFGNSIEGADITATVGTNEYTPKYYKDGIYNITLPYRKTKFTLNVHAEKVGYYPNDKEMTIYIDPITVDSTPPQILSVSFSPEQPNSSNEVEVRVIVNDTLTEVSLVILSYKTDTTWQNLTMFYNSSIGAYIAKIPAFENGTEVTFMIYAYDKAGNVAVSDLYQYTVIDISPGVGGVPTFAPPETTTGMLLIGGVATAVTVAMILLIYKRKRV